VSSSSWPGKRLAPGWRSPTEPGEPWLDQQGAGGVHHRWLMLHPVCPPNRKACWSGTVTRGRGPPIPSNTMRQELTRFRHDPLQCCLTPAFP
jgi:hypothetical protein